MTTPSSGLAAIVLILALTTQAEGTVRHVAITGSDANAGTALAPLRTIQRAADLSVAGDTVLVHPGDYSGFNVSRSGTPGAPISFIADPGVVVSTAAAPFRGNQRARINIDIASWIIIDGFEVIGSNDQRASRAGIRVVTVPDNPQTDVTIRNCHVHHNGEWGIFTGHVSRVTIEDCIIHHTFDEHGIYFSNSGDNHIARRNTIYSNSSQGIHVNSDSSQGGDGVMTGILIEQNTIYDNATGSVYIDSSGVTRTSVGGGSAINFDGVRDSVIRNNVLFGNRASGISLYRIDGLLPSSGNAVVNNTVINGIPGQPAAGRWCLNIQDGSTSTIIFNNILLNHHASRGSIDLCPSCTPGTVSDFNIVMDRFTLDGGSPVTLTQWRTATGLDAHSRALPPSQWAPLFVNLAANDYRLGSSSIAADFGIASLAGIAAPPVDRAGTARPSGAGFDAGAYERPCPADVTRDGGVDGDDIVLFFAWFDAADPRADFDASLGVDGDDVILFFGSWDAGC
jgi:hypothetical protein